MRTPTDTAPLPRLQLALNVSDLDAATDFYRRLFDAEPHKRRPGYVNFALDQPPLKLVLTEGEGPAGTLNHLGVEVADTTTVAAETARLAEVGLATDVRDEELCCHATQDKVWVTGPDGQRWEVYTVTDDDPADEGTDESVVCCA